MILQSAFSPSPLNSLSSAISYSLSFPSGSLSFTPLSKVRTFAHSLKCSSSVSQVHNHRGAVKYDKKAFVKWLQLFKRLSLNEDPEVGAGSVLNQVEKEGRRLTKWELCRVAKELRKFKKYKLGLEVYEWMNNRIERFNLSSSDAAIQLDLTAKVHGLSSAEDYFMRIPYEMKDKRVYGALLNAYVGAKERDKAESLLDQMRNKGYAIHPLPFNIMMTLYMKFEEYDKVNQLISEMKQKNVRLDIVSYNIWLTAQGSHGSAEGMEHVLEQIYLDSTINPNWATFSSMASFYIKWGQIEKAEECLRNIETKLTRGDYMPYHYLLSLYGTLGKIDKVHQVWNLYKSNFARIPNWGYHTLISALIRLGDIEGAENFYQEWLQGKSYFDTRIGNLLMGWYIHKEPFEKAKCFFDQMIEDGGRPTSGSWEILADGHTKEGRISDALSCFREAVSLAKRTKAWKPRPSNVSNFLELCEKEGDMASKDEFVRLLGEFGGFQDRTYNSVLAGHSHIEVGEDDDEMGEALNKESDMLLSAVE